VTVITESGGELDLARIVTHEVVEGLREAGVYRMAIPKEYGGDELTPAQMLAIAEELSALDGSTGWVGTLAAGNGAILVPRASKEALNRVFEAGPDPVIVGGPVPMARAREVDGGWAFESAYRFASGCLHGDWCMVGAFVMDGDAPRMTEHGPATVAGVVPTDQLPIAGSWDTLACVRRAASTSTLRASWSPRR
jgi:alkylation response protein AidB-like acyl-CoA dehydrogenase